MKPYRNAAYLRWIRSQPCVLSGAPADDAHHICGRLHLNLTGMAMKPGDEWSLPVSRDSHQAIHSSVELQHLQPEWLENTWRLALWHFGTESEIGQQIIGARRHMRAQLSGVAA